jgi:hypothetical protein
VASWDRTHRHLRTEFRVSELNKQFISPEYYIDSLIESLVKSEMRNLQLSLLMIALAGKAATALLISFVGGRAIAHQSIIGPRSDGLVLKMSEKPEKLKRLLGEAESEDAEWINTVFDSSMRDILDGEGPNMETNNSTDSDTKTLIGAPQQEVSLAEVAMESDSAVDGGTALALYALGYDDALIAEIKPKVLDIIVQRQLARPSRGVPDRWLIGSTSSADASDRSAYPSPSPSVLPRRGGYRLEENDRRRMKVSSSGGLSEIDDRDEGGEGFAWRGGSGQPQQPRQSTEYAGPLSLPTNNIPGRTARGSRSKLRAGDRERYDRNRVEEEERRGEKGEYEIGGAGDDLINLGVTTANPFWPTVEEFQDMLLQESMWRINLIGKWCTPAVKSETKWRNNLYRDFMYFLDEGLGDGFDTVEEETFGVGEYDDSYDDDYDDDYDNDDDDDGGDEGYSGDDDYDGEGGRGREQFPSNTRRGSYANDVGGVDDTAYERGERGYPPNEERRMRSGSLRPTRPYARRKRPTKQPRDRKLDSDLGEEEREQRRRARANRYRRDLERRALQSMNEEEWVEVEDAEDEAGRRAEQGMRVIGNLARKTVPGRVLEAWQEEEDKVAAGVYGDENDVYFDDDYAGGYRSRRSRAGKKARRSSERGRRARSEPITRESFFGVEDGGERQVRTRWVNDEDAEGDGEDDFYDLDGEYETRYQQSPSTARLKTRSTDESGTTIYSQEEFDKAYERSKKRAPHPPQ